jgi:two-component system, chemotaxis family, sensor kinase CheA
MALFGSNGADTAPLGGAMDDLLNDFLIETAESIESAGQQLVLFEDDPSNKAIVAQIFRLFHTIKGTCGFLNLTRLERLTHATEAMIGPLREGAEATPDTVSLILAAVDRVKFILSWLETEAREPDGDDADIIVAMQAALPAAESEAIPSAQIPAELAAAIQPLSDKKSLKPSREQMPKESNRPETIRVAVGALERIMLLVSELVLTRNQLLEITRHQEDAVTKAPLQRLSALTTDLQDAVMRARMQPVGRLFAGLPRLMRELSLETKKKLRLVTTGADTELDRQLIDLIRDPLTHLLRNCADHGIEQASVRLAAGKPEEGTICVGAAHEAGYITIEVCDDGRGLDVAAIRARALARGLTTQAALEQMSQEEICRFIFMPSFSTAVTVTNISGRGVGMDVVRTNIEAIGGSVSLSTTAGKGTRFTLRIPLTLAIAPALIVESGGHRFALPQHSVIEAVGTDAESTHSLERVQGSLVLRLRDEVVPVIDLEDVLQLERKACSIRTGSLVVVMRVSTRSFGIIVDAVSDVQEIVVKPLGASLAHLDVFSGHTILGDGSVVLILDPMGIAGHLGLERSTEYALGRTAEAFAPAEEKTRFVLFRAGPGAVKAIPLTLISRIESAAASAIRQSDGMYVMRHQGQLMPLVRVFASAVTPIGASTPILVLGVGGESMGLIVEEIVDVVEARLDIEIAGASVGVIGTAQINDEVVEIADATHFMQIGRPNAFARGFANRFRILLVDDKPFFLDMLAPLLTAVGYRVTTASSGHDALALIERVSAFDAVVTDTDMPDMTGYALARKLTEDRRRPPIPIIALAAHAAPAVVQAAAASGMYGAVGKFDRAGLMAMLGEILESHDLNLHTLESRIIGDVAA